MALSVCTACYWCLHNCLRFIFQTQKKNWYSFQLKPNSWWSLDWSKKINEPNETGEKREWKWWSSMCARIKLNVINTFKKITVSSIERSKTCSFDFVRVTTAHGTAQSSNEPKPDYVCRIFVFTLWII